MRGKYLSLFGWRRAGADLVEAFFDIQANGMSKS